MNLSNGEVSMSPDANNAGCSHVDSIEWVDPTSTVCDQCVAMGDTWVHLRACLSCGQVGCCDQSKNKHATRHYRASGHPIIRSLQPDENWIYCYVDRVMMVPE
jgi:uncharacterized UBP type Zn finger protein